ncbi:MAG TPA: cysteine synthase A [Bacteroidales bacterium]|nr:cysteine synthase A [Bacteroidales bacterium]HOK74274.1 cysteine synthase A [Bacteroidales bacterium]HPP92862.1 cysteine synthase A [Bacteroidales bacterium]HRR17364.1 cysteine synthase A [Bacteroidales bacterium]HRU57510.1 cysteine synthase A [Bacteroidales bacterium]
MKFYNIIDTIGNTPHIRLSALFPGHEVWIKDERRNPGGSIKDRIAAAMIEDAEKSGKLIPGGTIVEPTSGNTGIGLAMVGAGKGYRVILVMPASMSVERRKILRAFGAEVVITPPENGMRGAVEKAMEIMADIKGAWMPMQFENKANPDIHSKTTATEILSDFPEGFDFMVAGVGTGGHISGVGRILKGEFLSLKIIAVEPADSPVLSGGNPGPHKIQGIGAGFVPKNCNKEIIDRIIQVRNEDAYEMAREAARREGLFVGISTGASLHAVKILAEEASGTLRIICFAYDSGERYLSLDDLWNYD